MEQDILKKSYQSKLKKPLKSSVKRALIVNYFMNRNRHFSVEELYDEIKKMSLKISYSTVYRTLNLLSSIGLARECVFKDGMTRFEPAHRSRHHDHLVCERCGKIIEFEEPKIEKLQKEVARRHKFTVDWHRMELYGLCAECKKKEKL